MNRTTNRPLAHKRLNGTKSVATFDTECYFCSREIKMNENILFYHEGKYKHLVCPVDDKTMLQEKQGKLMKSKFAGRCYVCSENIKKGSNIYFNGQARHSKCFPLIK